MRRFGFVILFFISAFNNTSAQSFDVGSWNILNIKYNHSDTLSVFGEGQIRSLNLYSQFHYHEIKAGINYNIHKSVKLTLGMGSYQTYKEGGNFKLPKNNDEFRLWPQMILAQEIHALKIEQRYRTEMRWTSKGYRNRFRYRAGISYPFGIGANGSTPFLASVSNEIFFTDNEPYYERNRIQMILNYKITKHSTIQIGYLHQFDYKINDETGRDFLVIGFYFDIFRQSTSLTEQDHELNDN